VRTPGLFLKVACAIGVSCANAAPLPPAPAPGEYVASGGWAVLRVTRVAGDAAQFSIRSEGANGHACALNGALRDGHVLVSNLPPASACVVHFATRGRAVDVSTNADPSCQPSFCGVRAGFTGQYLRTPPGCSTAERRQIGDDFKHAYDGKNFGAAQSQARRLLDGCADTMDWNERSRLRNDLAVTEYHLGHYTECIGVLQPLAEDAARTDAELRERLPPADYENDLPIVQAARTNLGLCEGLKRSR